VLCFQTMATIRLLSSNDAEGIGIVIGVLAKGVLAKKNVFWNAERAKAQMYIDGI
jgi:hypothetical protein